MDFFDTLKDPKVPPADGMFIGGDGLSSIGKYKIKNLSFAKRFKLLKTRTLDGDVLEEWNKIN